MSALKVILVVQSEKQTIKEKTIAKSWLNNMIYMYWNTMVHNMLYIIHVL